MQLEQGWDSRTKQKLALAGCLAAALSLRKTPLSSGSRLRDFAQKLIGYSSAAVIFSGAQETARAVRGRHDFLNSAFSGAIAGGIIVPYYQGPQYRLLGVVTWGSLCATLHLVNALVRPRYLLEDYLIREGLLSPEVARRREEEALRAAHGSGGAKALDYRDPTVESMAIRERELRELNQRLAAEHFAATSAGRHTAPAGAGAASRASSSAGSGGPVGADEDDLADDDPGYVAWLRSSGLDAEELLQPSVSPSTSSALGQPHAAVQEQRRAATAASSDKGEANGKTEAGPEAVPGKRRTWAEWLKSWRFGSKKAGVEDAAGAGGRAN